MTLRKIIVLAADDNKYMETRRSLLSFMALYDWTEALDLSARPDILIGLLDDARIVSTKATFHVAGDKLSRRRTIYKNSKFIEVLKQFPEYVWVALDEPIKGDFGNVRSHLTFSSDIKLYLIAKTFNSFGAQEALAHARLFCKFATPRYGFFHTERGFSALAFPWGIAEINSDPVVTRRVSDLGQSLRVTKEHLSGKLHDAYALNILSPLHLERTVAGISLHSWIQSGQRGSLTAINKDVYAWIIPDDVRPRVRADLFQAGALIATV